MAEAEETAAETPAPKSPTNKILPIILVVNTLLMTGVLIFVMKRPAAQAAGGAKEHAAEKEHDKGKEKDHGEGAKAAGGEHGADTDVPGPMMKLENFTVQVRAVEGDRYAHMTVEVELASELDKKAFETRMPRIRDAVIGYVADRSEDELRGSEGLAQVKQALIKKLDEIVPGHRVRGLFVTEFIIQ